MDIVIWHPYLDCEGWWEDDDELPYMFCPRWMVGRFDTIIERFCFGQVSKQYGRIQEIPLGNALYARVQAERSLWDLSIDYQFALSQIVGMPFCRWEMLSSMADARMSHEYRDWWSWNRFIHFTDPAEPIPA